MSKQQPLSKGALILQEKPFAYIVKSKYIRDRCDSCLGSGHGKLFKCGGCQFSHYCGVLCQRDAWAEHKYECLCMKKIAPRVLPDAARMMAKIIWKLQYGGYLQKFYYSRNGFRKFNDLMPHLDDIKYDERKVEHMQSLHAILKEYLMPEHFPNDTEFMGIYGRLCINSFNILDDDLNSVGTGIYLAASILDHSCKPNAVAIFDGPQLSIRLIEDIPELDWNKIRISYVDQMDLAEVRLAELKKRYYFDCDCPKCTDDTYTSKMTAMACPSEKDCDGFVSLTDEKCKECECPITDEHRQNYEDVLDMTKQCIQDIENSGTRYIDVCRHLNKRQTKVLHEKNIWRIKSMDLAFDGAIDFESWDEAIVWGEKFIRGLKFYTTELNPLIGLAELKLGKICATNEVSDFRASLRHLREAADVLKITHGDQSRVMRDFVRPLTVESQHLLDESQRVTMPVFDDEEEEEA